MRQLSSFTRSLVLALPLTFGTALAMAQSTENAQGDLQRVEISSQRPSKIARVDVQANCPGIAQTLREQLAEPLERNGEAGTVRVYFRVDDGGTAEIESSGGPLVNRKYIRRAMHQVECRQEAQAHRFTFLVSFTPEGQRADAAGGPQRVALALLEQ